MLRVAITGGGVGGMTLAAILARAPGIDVTVMERFSEHADQGTGFDLSGLSQKIVAEEAGLGRDTLARVSRRDSGTMKFFLSNSKRDDDFLAVMYRPKILSWFMDARPETNRQQLVAALADAAREATLDQNKDDDDRGNRFDLLHNVAVSRVEPFSTTQGQGVAVIADDGEERVFDAVIDASGFASPLRPQRVANEESKSMWFTKKTMIHGVVNRPEDVLPPGIVARMGEGTAMVMGPYGRSMTIQRFGTGRDGDNRTSVYYSLPSDEPGAVSEAIGVPKTTRLHDAGDPSYESIVAWTNDDIRAMGWTDDFLLVPQAFDKVAVRPIFQHPIQPELKDDALAKAPFALMGDALHAVPPWTGSGGNLAIEDAHDFAEVITHLATEPDASVRSLKLTQAFRDIEKRSLNRAQKVLEESDERQRLTRELFDDASPEKIESLTLKDVLGGNEILASIVSLLSWAYKNGY